jgi:uncharacterized protein (DUF427 family)
VIQATWNGAVVAQSDHTIVVEGNHYFPADSVRREFLQESPTYTHCFWKGKANYFHVVVDGKTNPDAAWYYPSPARAASRIAGHVAFWHGVRVEPVADGEPAPKGSLVSRLLRRPSMGSHQLTDNRGA